MAVAVGGAPTTLTGTMFTGAQSFAAARPPVSPAPREQHVGVQTVAPRHLRNGRARRKAFCDDPLLLISRPRSSPALAAIRALHPRVRHLR